MDATQALTGQGGWPMTVFLTPQGRPVLRRHLLPAAPAARHAVVPAGAAARSARPGATQRDEVEAAGGRIAAALAGAARRRRRRPPDDAVLTAAVDAAGGRRGRRARRLRRRPEVPAVDGPGVAAAARGPAPARGTGPDGRRRGVRGRLGAVALGSPGAPCARWPAAACTTSSRAGSPATPSTPAGSCRTSRRCCTTTPCSPGSTCTGGG